MGNQSGWRREFGGMPVWGAVLTVAALVAMAVFAITNLPRVPQSAAAPQVNVTPTVAPEESATPAIEPLALPGEGGLVYLIGDSWAAGETADEGQGFTDVIGRETGWDMTVNAQRGTGYVAVLDSAGGEPFPDRITQLPSTPPALIIIQGGLNDANVPVADVRSAASATVENAAKRFPNVPIVLVGPATTSLPLPERLAGIDTALSGVASDAGARYISPASEGWVNTANISTFIDSDTNHPSNEGHAEYAKRLLAALNGTA